MVLKSIEYSQFVGKPNAWYLECFMLEKINLIVGKNATGKTKILNVIRGISFLLAGEQKVTFDSGNYKMIFDKDGQDIEYTLCIENAEIYKEGLKIGKDNLLDRGIRGEGTIFAKQLNRNMNFQAPVNELACVARRDSLQHPFFEDLHQWGKTTFHYFFGTQLGKDHLAVFTKDQKKDEVLNLKDTNRVVGFFKQGMNKHGTVFVNSIKKDMERIGYKIDEISTGPLRTVKMQGVLLGSPEGLLVKEADIPVMIDQNEMSQGMFRALSLIIQITLSQLESTPSCVLIDDIGEGLDFERSSTLVKLLIEKAEKSSIQLIMSTNDRFIMNNVPLKYWGVVQRTSQSCKVFNYNNSKKIFDDFAFTGLSNFDFLATEFYQKGFDKE